jgi:uncharacterized protein (UPF0548 family)
MSVALLGADQVAQLRRRALTYAEIGRTAGTPPAGFRSFTRTATLVMGQDFSAAAQALLTWQMHARAGLKVAASSLDVRVDAVVVLRVALGPLGLSVPCRVVYIVDEPDRQGFAYGTLPGHPESGEEAFVVQRRANGQIDFVVTAFSRPASTLARLGGPVSRGLQHLMTARYLHALDG